MSVTFVQATGNHNNSASILTVAYASGTTLGSLLIVACVTPSDPASPVSDSIGNTWTQLYTANGNAWQAWYAINKGSGANTVTITQGAAAVMHATILEYTGQASSSPIDVVSTEATATGTAISVPVTTLTANDILLALVQLDSSNGTFTAGSGYTTRASSPSTSLICAEDSQVTTAGAYTATATLGTSQTWQGWVVAIKPFISGGGVTTTRTQAPTPSTVCAANGATWPITSPTLGVKLGQPVPVVFTDANGNELAVTGSSKTGNAGSPTPVVLCDGTCHPLVAPIVFTSNGGTLTVSSTLTGTKLGQPVPVVSTDQNGFFYALAGFTLGSMAGNPTPIVLTDANGNVLVLSGVAT